MLKILFCLWIWLLLDDSVAQISVWYLEELGICGGVDDCTTTAARFGYLGYLGQCSNILATSFKFITTVANFKRSFQPFDCWAFYKARASLK